MCRNCTEKSIGSSRSIHLLLGNRSARAVEAYRDSGEARCPNYPQHLPAWSSPRWTGNLPLFSKHVLHCSERALVASQITPTSAPALDSSSMSRAARGSAVGGHERRCSTLRLLRRCSRPPRCHHLAASHVAAAPPLLRHAAGQRRAWLRSASRSVSSCSLDEFMSDERCSACVRKTSESVSQ